MGIFSRFRKKSRIGREGGLPKKPKPPETPQSGPTSSPQGLPKKENPPTEADVKIPEDVAMVPEAELAGRKTEEALVKEAIERSQPTEIIEVKEDTPPKKRSALSRFLMKLAEQNNHRNWSPNSVGEKVFLTQRDAQAFAKEMRRAGYRAKVVRLKNGIYKVYIYRNGGRSTAFNFDMKGMKTFKFDIGLSQRKKDTIKDFKLDLRGLDDFGNFKLDLKGLDEFEF